MRLTRSLRGWKRTPRASSSCSTSSSRSRTACSKRRRSTSFRKSGKTSDVPGGGTVTASRTSLFFPTRTRQIQEGKNTNKLKTALVSLVRFAERPRNIKSARDNTNHLRERRRSNVCLSLPERRVDRDAGLRCAICSPSRRAGNAAGPAGISRATPRPARSKIKVQMRPHTRKRYDSRREDIVCRIQTRSMVCQGKSHTSAARHREREREREGESPKTPCWEEDWPKMVSMSSTPTRVRASRIRAPPTAARRRPTRLSRETASSRETLVIPTRVWCVSLLELGRGELPARARERKKQRARRRATA